MFMSYHLFPDSVHENFSYDSNSGRPHSLQTPQTLSDIGFFVVLACHSAVLDGFN